MARFHGYTNAGNGIERISAESRTREKVAEVNRDVNDIRSEILTLKIMVKAMMEIMAERGVEPEIINAKIQEIASRPDTFMPTAKLSTPCPRCGRLVLDNGNTPLVGTCLYCGEVVKFIPVFETGDKEQELSQSDSITEDL